MQRGNLKAGIPAARPDELFTPLTSGAGVRIERIVSRGQVSPPGFWYDQPEHEFVLLLEGEARLLVEGEPELNLGPGDWLELPAHTRHRVTFTAPDRDTVWLAVFYRPS
jgi:cupin 2 domain-containing protein